MDDDVLYKVLAISGLAGCSCLFAIAFKYCPRFCRRPEADAYRIHPIL